MYVWICVFSSVLCLRISFFFLFFLAVMFDFSTRALQTSKMGGKQCTPMDRALFTRPTNFTFNNFFITNGFHGTIHIFKNYFATVFSVSVFSKISCIQMDPIIGSSFYYFCWLWIPLYKDKIKRVR